MRLAVDVMGGDHAPDVVLKALVAHTRQGDNRGEVVGLKDGGTYIWFLLGSEVERLNDAA